MQEALDSGIINNYLNTYQVLELVYSNGTDLKDPFFWRIII
jgi:hypothetical protein